VSLLSRILKPRVDDRAPVRPLWHRITELARDPRWFTTCGVADTVPGRFDAVTLVFVLVLLRMEREEALIPPSVHMTELFIADMDGQLRQSGVGDLSVGKHIGKLMGVLGGRLGAFREALPLGLDAVTAAIARNVSLVEGADPAHGAELALAFARTLQATSAEDLLAARIAL
jgi:cytochrome b pre-mRNA-processing protein 3